MLLVHLSSYKHNYHAKFHLSCWSGSTFYQPFSLGTLINRQGNLTAPAKREHAHCQDHCPFQLSLWQFLNKHEPHSDLWLWGTSCLNCPTGHCLFVSLVDFMFSGNSMLLAPLQDHTCRWFRLMQLLQREQAAAEFTMIMTLYQQHKSCPCHRQQAASASTEHHF